MLLVEGFFMFFFTKLIIKIMKLIQEIEINKIKNISLVSFFIGGIIIYLTFRIYGIE